jgi:hypothetical protein
MHFRSWCTVYIMAGIFLFGHKCIQYTHSNLGSIIFDGFEVNSHYCSHLKFGGFGQGF